MRLDLFILSLDREVIPSRRHSISSPRWAILALVAGRRTERKYREDRGTGAVSWQSRDSVAKSLRRANWAIGGLAVMGLFWAAGLTEPPITADDLLGFSILEVLTIVPLVCALVWRRRTKRLLKRIDHTPEPDLEALTGQLRAVDDEVYALGRLVAELDPGPILAVGREALQAAESASSVRRQLLERRHQLQHLGDLVVRGRARDSVHQSLVACDAELATIEGRVGELAASISRLVDRAADSAVHDQADEIASVSQHVDALVAGLTEIASVDAPPQQLGSAP